MVVGKPVLKFNNRGLIILFLIGNFVVFVTVYGRLQAGNVVVNVRAHSL